MHDPCYKSSIRKTKDRLVVYVVGYYSAGKLGIFGD